MCFFVKNALFLVKNALFMSKMLFFLSKMLFYCQKWSFLVKNAIYLCQKCFFFVKNALFFFRQKRPFIVKNALFWSKMFFFLVKTASFLKKCFIFRKIGYPSNNWKIYSQEFHQWGHIEYLKIVTYVGWRGVLNEWYFGVPLFRNTYLGPNLALIWPNYGQGINIF